MNKELRFEQIMTKIFVILAIILFSYLFISSLLLTGNNDWDIANELIYLKYDNIFINILKLLIFIVLLYFVCVVINKIRNRKAICVGLVSTIIIVFTISVLLINGANTTPQADQLFVCDNASLFNIGDYSGLNKGGYVSICPHQLGFLSFVRIMFILFGDPNYKAIQYANAIGNIFIVLSGFMITKKISKNNNKALWSYLVLITLCIPMYYYSMFIYGEILSTSFVLLSCWMLLEVNDKGKKIYIVLYGIFLSISIVLRTNCYIVLIANVLVLLIKIIQNKNRTHIYLLISLVTFTIVGQLGLKMSYISHMKEDAGAIPAISYLVMGLNDDKECPGWHNDYINNLIKDCDYNEQLAKEIAFNDYKERLVYFVSNPKYTIDFLNRKIQCQWNSPMYQSIHMNSYINGEQNKLGYSAYFGTIRHIAELFMKIYQMALYGSVLLYLFFNRKNSNIENYLLLICVFGGFVFSLFWEAKTRYIFPYLLMMVPYFAIGATSVVEHISTKNTKKITD